MKSLSQIALRLALMADASRWTVAQSWPCVSAPIVGSVVAPRVSVADFTGFVTDQIDAYTDGVPATVRSFQGKVSA